MKQAFWYVVAFVFFLSMFRMANPSQAQEAFTPMPASTVGVLVEQTVLPISPPETPEPTALPTAESPFAALDCYGSVVSQFEINTCGNKRRDDMYNKMTFVVHQVVALYHQMDVIAPTAGVNFQTLQTQWEAVAEQECDYLWAKVVEDQEAGSLHYLNGTTAPAVRSECLVAKYQARIGELQTVIAYYEE